MILSPLQFVALEEIGRRDFQRIAENVQRAQVNTLGVAFGAHQSLSRREGHAALGGFLEPVRGADTTRRHQLGKSKSHVQHVTNVATEAVRSNSSYPLVAMVACDHIRRMDTSAAVLVPLPLDPPDITALDASHDRLCVVCRASFREGGFLCASCRFEFEPEPAA